MFQLKISLKLSIKLLTTNKAFICYNLNEDKTTIDNYVLTNDLYRYKNRFEGFKAISCIKNEYKKIIF